MTKISSYSTSQTLSADVQTPMGVPYMWLALVLFGSAVKASSLSWDRDQGATSEATKKLEKRTSSSGDFQQKTYGESMLVNYLDLVADRPYKFHEEFQENSKTLASCMHVLPCLFRGTTLTQAITTKQKQTILITRISCCRDTSVRMLSANCSVLLYRGSFAARSNLRALISTRVQYRSG
eukprot:g61024.t1